MISVLFLRRSLREGKRLLMKSTKDIFSLTIIYLSYVDVFLFSHFSMSPIKGYFSREMICWESRKVISDN